MSAPSIFRIAGCGILCLTFLIFNGCAPPSGNPEAGKKWYSMHNCGSCHGPQGYNGRATSIAGLDMGFRSFVRRLRRTDAPIMPYFPESKISKQDAADIYVYLKSLERP
jgi:mono/diheme cytochrome c family protein